MKKNVLFLILGSILLGSALLLAPPPGLNVAAWRLFWLFVTTILALIFHPFPEPVLLMISITLAGALALPLPLILSGYTDNVLWLTITAMMLSIGLKKSGLMHRLALILISKYCKTTLELGYIVSLLDLILAISTPASPARTGGIIYPLTAGIIEACKKGHRVVPKELGSYLILLIYMASMTTGSIFMTGMAPNLINVKLAQSLLGLHITWIMWLKAAVPGLLGFLLLPYLLYRLCPPELCRLDALKASAAQKLTALGGLTKQEYLTASIFFLVLLLWSTESLTGINTTWVGFLGVTLMFILRILAWKDIASAKEIWSLFIWFGAILGFSNALLKVGFFAWVTKLLAAALANLHCGLYLLFPLLAALATLPHYLFASLGGYVAAFAPLLFSFINVTQMPARPAFFLVAFLMVISSSLTHYGNALGPMLMGLGFTRKGTWWGCGLLVTLLQASIYLSFGLIYWRFIGLW